MSDIPTALQKADWKAVVPEVIRRALGLIGNRPNANDLAQDLVQQAIAKLLIGRRTWDPSQCSLSDHLMSTVSSDLYHYYHSLERRLVAELDEQIVKLADYRAPSPEQVEIKRKSEHEFLQFVDARNAKAGLLARLILREGMHKTSEFVAAIGINEQAVRRLKKNLTVLVSDYRSERGDDEILTVVGGYADER